MESHKRAVMVGVVLFVLMDLVVSGCDLMRWVFFDETQSRTQLASFAVTVAGNPERLLADAQGEIDHDDQVVTIHVPTGTIVTDLRPEFVLKRQGEMRVNGETQVSGQSAQDFSQPIAYDLYDGG